MDQNKQIKPWPLEAKTGLALSLAATVVIGGVLIFGRNRDYVSTDSTGTSVTNYTSNINENENSEKVVNEKIELLQKPYLVDAKIARHFFDINDDIETRTKAVIQIPNKESTFIKSVGVDYHLNGASFDVLAACSGVVKERISDATYGNMLLIEHESGLQTIYSSLESFNVVKGNEVKQGQVIGRAGNSLYTSEIGVSLHFEIMKNGKHINPEKSYALEVKAI